MKRKFDYRALVLATATALGATSVYAHSLRDDADDYQSQSEHSQDRVLATDVHEALQRAPDLDAGHIQVRAENGVVSLSGTVDSAEQRRMAHEIGHSVPGVRDVYVDDLQVAARAVSPTAGSEDARLHDDVHEALEHTRGIDTSNLEVSVHDGVVYLKGSVPNHSQKVYAHDVAHSVPGVREVNTRGLEVIG